MKTWIFLILLSGILAFPEAICQTIYTNYDDFKEALSVAEAGDEIIFADGVYEAESVTLDARIGTAENPIIVRAETIGGVTLNNGTYFDLRHCAYVTIQGFEINIVDVSTTFKIQTCNNIRIAHNIFNGENETNSSSVWLMIQSFWSDPVNLSHHNRIDHNIFTNKHSLGNMIRIDGTNGLYVSQYDVIEYNYFKNMGPRATNEMEAIRIGWSEMSESDGFTQVTNNLFEECNGDPEIISVKCNKNTIAHNTFRRCQGTLSLRHGNQSVIDGNFFLGEGAEGTGGVRIYGSDHKIINNYFQGLTGTRWDAPITLTEGDAEEGNGSLSKHFRIERALIANNTLVNNTHGIEIGYDNGGSYSKPPRDVVMAYNVFVGDTNSFVKYINQPDNMSWLGNIVKLNENAIIGDGVTFTSDEVAELDPNLIINSELLYYKASEISPVYTQSSTLSTEVIRDIDGHIRSEETNYGADEYLDSPILYKPLNASDVGPALGDYLLVSDDDILFSVHKDTLIVSIQSNLNWEVAEELEWLVVSPAIGSGFREINLIVTENSSGLIRSGSITLSGTNIAEGEELTTSIVVTQSDKEDPIITLSSDQLLFESSGGNLPLSIFSNTEWYVSTDVDWLSLSAEGGTKDFELIVTAAENESMNRRYGSVAITDGDEIVKNISVEQAAVVGTEVKLPIVSALANAEQTDEGNIANNVFDGILTNRWSGDGDGTYITLDLGEKALVSFLKVGLFKGDERNSYFDILTSEDDVFYEDALLGITSDITSEPFLIYNFDDDTARYVRVIGHGNSSSSWNSFTEFEVYGWTIETSSFINEQKLNAMEISIHPNPTKGIFTISNCQGAHAKIFDVAGNLVFQKQYIDDEQLVDVPLVKGFYYVVLQSGIDKKIRKLVVE